MIDFTALSAIVEKDIKPVIVNQSYKKAPLWQLVGGWSAEERVAKRANVDVEQFVNNVMYIPIMTQNHSGIVGTGINGTYVYGQPQFTQVQSPIKTIIGSFLIPKQVLNVKDAGAVEKPLLLMTRTLSENLANDFNRQCYNDGSGVLATTNATQGGGGSTTVVLAPSLNGDQSFADYFGVGMSIQIGSNAAVLVTGRTGDNTITIASAQTWSAGATIKKLDGDGVASAELDGLKSMIAATGAYQSYDPATDYNWKSIVSDGGGTTQETTSTIVNDMQKTFFSANKKGDVDWIVVNSRAFQMYGQALFNQVRFDSKQVLSGGWKGLEFMGGNANVLLDYDCPDDRIPFLSTSKFVFGEYQPLEFEKGTDGVMFKIANKLTYEITASWMGNVGTTQRNAFGLMKGYLF